MRGGVYAKNGAGVRGAMRACSACAGDYVDPDRTAWTPDDAEADALPAGQHFRPIAAFAQGGVRRLRGGEATARHEQNPARRRLRNGLGVSAEARDSQEGRESAWAKRWEESFVADGCSLNRDGVGAEER